MSDSKRRWDLEQVSHETGGGVVLVGADGAILMRSEGAAVYLGNPADFDAAWKGIHAGIQRELLARRASEVEVTLELRLGDGDLRPGERSDDVVQPEDMPTVGEQARDGRSVVRTGDVEAGYERTGAVRAAMAPAGSSLFVRVLRVGKVGRGGYLAIFTEWRALDALQVNLRLAAKMRRLHATYGQAAHDLRAPLNAIALGLDLVLQHVADDRAGPEARLAAAARVELLQREVTRLSRMLQVLLAQSLPTRHSTRAFGLGRVLREAIDLVAPQADRLGIRIGLHLPDRRLEVLAARDDLKQALLNLLLNGLESMPRGGPLEVELCSNGTRAVIRIRDHGVGIPACDFDAIFGIHFSTKPGGSGIGLFTARAAIESMGGTLALQSTEGAGTTASIELPLAGSAAAHEVPCSTS